MSEVLLAALNVREYRRLVEDVGEPVGVLFNRIGCGLILVARLSR